MASLPDLTTDAFICIIIIYRKCLINSHKVRCFHIMPTQNAGGGKILHPLQVVVLVHLPVLSPHGTRFSCSLFFYHLPLLLYFSCSRIRRGFAHCTALILVRIFLTSCICILRAIALN